MKKIFFIIGLTLLLSACNSLTPESPPMEKVVDDSVEEQAESPNLSTGIVAGSIEPSLKKIDSSSSNTFQYTLKNQTERKAVLLFPTTQLFDYEVHDELGKLLFTYSSGKEFIQTAKEIALQPAEEWSTSISLPNFEPGTYTLTVWSKAIENPYKQSTTFTVE
ncbi:BsuPI-related putative proteinase inhibitor [Bacillus spongiae]|uniref:Intracellular proteinase inhibitor BsuPI domain-containing protein n=1 Tax=Bacillus spongiae TaxID=2683610 RepID=A0ABU8HHD3_9BACI